MLIHLNDSEESQALNAAKLRQSESVKRRNQNRYGARKNRTQDEDLLLHLQGCRGELAAGKAYGTNVSLHVNVYHSLADIGTVGEVRTRSDAAYDLIVRATDPSDRYYILVIGSCMHGTPLDVIGGIWGLEAKKKEYIADYGGHGSAWFVPQEVLQPPEDIPPGWL